MEEKADLERGTRLHQRSDNDYCCFFPSGRRVPEPIRLDKPRANCQHRDGYFGRRCCARVPFILDYQAARTVPENQKRKWLHQAKMGLDV